ncbi:thymidylate kinase [Hamadaea flava]|nr:thymidylate kinase [Hamadaea flava]
MTSAATDPLVVALVGIDGCGKTSVAHELRRQAGSEQDVTVLHTIRPHEAPNGPLHELSRQLEELSAAADRLHSPHLKIAAFYLQLATYGPAQRLAVDAWRPRVIVADRHPLVDSLVYLPLYAKALARSAVPPAPPPAVLPVDPLVLLGVRAWARRIGCDTDLWRLGADLLAMYALPPEDLVRHLSDTFAIALPDIVVLLDVPPEQAIARLDRRGRGAEIHESAAQLAAVARGYEQVLDWLSGVGVLVLRLREPGGVAEVAAAVAAQAYAGRPPVLVPAAG